MENEVINTHSIEKSVQSQRVHNGSVILKRTFDIVISALALLFLSPILLFIAILIKREGPGPVFYRGPRLGRAGKPFGILKFRTMYERKESYEGARLTTNGDSRITPLGHWLRDTKINELPQLWNVLIGEMSLVGPRPEDPKLAEEWPEDVRVEVLSIRPGITSPASVLYRNEESLLRPDKLLETYFGNILPSKLRLDQLYVRHHSFMMDLDIIFWTIITLLPGRKDEKVQEARLFWGPLSKLVRRYGSWFFVDTLVVLASFAIAGGTFRLFTTLDVGYLQSFGIAVGFSLLFSLIGAAAGVQKIVWSKAPAEDALDLIPSTVLAGLIILGIDWYFKIFPSGMIFLTIFLSLTGFIIVRYRQRLITGALSRWLAWRKDASLMQERVLIVGSGDAGRLAAWMIDNTRDAQAMKVVGYIDDDLYKQQTRLGGVPILGQRDDIPAVVKKHDVGLIIYAIHNIPEKESKSILNLCKSTGTKLVRLPNLLDMLHLPENAVSSGEGDSFQPIGVGANPFSQTTLLDQLTLLENNLNSGDIIAAKENLQDIKVNLKSNKYSGGS